MVVCSSRPHAVRMWEALRGYVENRGYDIGVLVAFSGEVEDLTEARANGFPESQTAERFDTDEWRVMVVAEKFQTGFDQPKLVAMYVDKTLTGLAAVQTLSRLNRIHPDKAGTFVLDFVNDGDDIRDAFAVYHGKTIAPPTDPNLLFDTRHALDGFHVLDPSEMRRAAMLLVADGAHAQIDAALQPAVDRFHDLDDDDRAAFRDVLTRFVRVYGFLAQIVPFANPGLERDYIYCRALAALVRDRQPGHSIDLGAEVELTHLRHEMTFEGSISLPGGEIEVITIYSGTGPLTDPDEEPLSEIIARINERFGRRCRRRLHPRLRRRLRHLHQTRPPRRPRPMGPTPPKPNPHPPRRPRPLPRHLAVPHHQQPPPSPHQHRTLHLPHPRTQSQQRNLLAPHPRLDHRSNQQSRTRPHHRPTMAPHSLMATTRAVVTAADAQPHPRR